MPTTIDLTEEQKVWVDEVTHVLTTARLPLNPAFDDMPEVTRYTGTRTHVLSVRILIGSKKRAASGNAP